MYLCISIYIYIYMGQGYRVMTMPSTRVLHGSFRPEDYVMLRSMWLKEFPTAPSVGPYLL